MSGPHGIHHVTAIAGAPQENLDFYAGVVGMRLVKRSVNQDDPGTYHLFYADAEGHPGCDLTFFPWTQPAPGRLGAGLAVEVALAVPPGSLPWWSQRLERYGAGPGEPEVRFGERALLASDPHGLALAFVETGDPWDSTPWEASPVPAEMQVRGLHGARIWERSLATTGEFLTGAMGFTPAGESDGWHRFALAGGGSGKWLEVRELPDAHRGLWGVGSVHHIAWRVPDDAVQLELRARVAEAGRHPTPVIDRFWFHSVYFKEPGGVLFELATDGPGFGVDEDLAALGERLVLPPWLEADRLAIEARLPDLGPPSPSPRP